MANLKNRLKLIRELKQNRSKKELPVQKTIIQNSNITKINIPGWEQCGHMTIKRNIQKKLELKINYNIDHLLPHALKMIIPDLSKYQMLKLKDFLFFDLETTGLSGGAGTIAFLAAFGRFLHNNTKEIYLEIRQYLLLDYPGQHDFLVSVLKEFNNNNSIIVSYNGKSFDSQILKNMCLMNGFKPPEYRHADLLHPARRLWKNILTDCSQNSIEIGILGLSRDSDIPGSLAPDIWFEYLKSGNLNKLTNRLIGICDHNISDIEGLSYILSAMIEISINPLKSKYKIYIPRLTFFWRSYLCRNKNYNLPENKNILEMMVKLLNFIKDSGKEYGYSREIKQRALKFLLIYYNRWRKTR